MRRLFQVACSRRIAKNSLRISLVVGGVLNVINQSEAIMAGEGVSWAHLMLNFMVPYCVASYSAAKNEMTQRDNE